jgi:hypothetical protein
MSRLEIKGITIKRCRARIDNLWQSVEPDLSTIPCDQQSISFIYKQSEEYKIYCRILSDQPDIRTYIKPVLKRDMHNYGLIAGSETYKEIDNQVKLDCIVPKTKYEYIKDLIWPTKSATFQNKGKYILDIRLGTVPSSYYNAAPPEWKVNKLFPIEITQFIPI